LELPQIVFTFQADFLRNPLGLNVYPYVSNNPLRFSDPFGLEGRKNTPIQNVVINLGRVLGLNWGTARGEIWGAAIGGVIGGILGGPGGAAAGRTIGGALGAAYGGTIGSGLGAAAGEAVSGGSAGG